MFFAVTNQTGWYYWYPQYTWRRPNLGCGHFGSSRMTGNAQRTFKVTLQKTFSRESREVSWRWGRLMNLTQEWSCQRGVEIFPIHSGKQIDTLSKYIYIYLAQPPEHNLGFKNKRNWERRLSKTSKNCFTSWTHWSPSSGAWGHFYHDVSSE